ncbi:hypothetical protein [Epilithonimonas sp. UC225_85]|uniref:hypothetical protein n=1 Tax=Epilithonimonas sp. UC225_85 TaxID=3350167 RepID=UPI0036D3714B
MKVSNKKNIEAIGLCLIFSIPVIVAVMIFDFMIIKKIDVISTILIVLMLLIVLLLYTLRYKEFENSGYVITIVKKHPLLAKSFKSPVLEFPVNLLQDFHIKGNIIYLTLKSNNTATEKTHVLKFILSGFNDKQRQQIITSLSETIKNN